MEEDLFSQSREASSSGKDNIIAWTLALLLLVGLVAGAWVASYMIFSQPEKPFNYKILDRFGQLEDLKKFSPAEAPRGEFLSAVTAYERYINLPDYELNNRNQEMFRHYIENYSNLTDRLPYLVGKFKVVDSYTLSADDIIASGVVVVAESQEYPPVLVQCVYPCAERDASLLKRALQSGSIINLQRTKDLAAFLNISKTKDQRLVISVVPLLYGGYTMASLDRAIQLAAPASLNVDAGWPVIKLNELRVPDTAYQEFLKQKQLTENKANAIPVLTPTDTVQPAIPATSPSTPALAINPDATPVPVAPAVPLNQASEQPVATAVKPSDITAITTAKPEAEQDEPSTAIALPDTATEPQTTNADPTPPQQTKQVAPASTAQGAPLKPFSESLQATPPTTAPATTPRSGSQDQSSTRWKLYSPGRMPRGRLLTPDKAARLAGSGTSGERLYLRGSFEVTAASQFTAVMRSRDGGFTIPGFRKPTRIVVDYAEPGQAPAEGTAFTRGSLRPFQIIDVREGEDGVVNIITREITTP